MSNSVYEKNGLEIAIIGMSVRLPGADTLEEFRNNLQNGTESIQEFSNEQLDNSGIPESVYNKENYVRSKGVLKEGMSFEPEVFGYSYREAKLMDPQLRVYHECVYQALNDASYNTEYYEGPIGIYGGAGNNPLWSTQFLLNGNNNIAQGYELVNFNSQEYFNTRIAYSLNFYGPAMTVQTACSSSLVAVHLAAQGLIAGDCDIAVAGGVEMSTDSLLNDPDIFGHEYQEGMIFSPDGKCRPFDENANGTVFSDGAGCVVLKRLEDAINDNDNIYAVIKGTAINNDGKDKIGFTAPSVEGQAQVIRSAHQISEVEPETINYIEAHGTGTSLGDPIEIQALTEAFDSQKRAFCKIGSVKSNIGHIGAAAGIAGLIKTVLSLKYNELPASLNYIAANPKIAIDDTPFVINHESIKWKNSQFPLRAGVSSFGIGGTNAHIILEEFKPENLIEEPVGEHEYAMIFLSAIKEKSLHKQSVNLANYLKENKHLNIKDIEYSLQVGRTHHSYRKAVIAKDIDSIIDGLSLNDNNKAYLGNSKHPKCVFVFPGQGSQYLSMGKELYENHLGIKKIIDECFDSIAADFRMELKSVFFNENEDDKLIHNTAFTQPLLFIIEYATAKYLLQLNVTPWAMIGHSLGEYVAATISGVFQLKDVLDLVSYRGKLMSSTENGEMLSIAANYKDVCQLIPANICIAAINSDKGFVVSGKCQLIQELIKILNENNVANILLTTSHAYHSELMEPILDDFKQRLSIIELSEPNIPYISNLTGDWVDPKQVVQPEYWVDHLRNTVLFRDGLTTVLKEKDLLFLELGPGKTLSNFIRQHANNMTSNIILNALKAKQESMSDSEYFVRFLSRMHISGQKINWNKYNTSSARKRLSLPGFVFSRSKFNSTSKQKQSNELFARQKHDKDVSLFIPNWMRQPITHEYVSSKKAISSTWLILSDQEVANDFAVALMNTDSKVIRVSNGNKYKRIDRNNFEVNMSSYTDFESLFNELIRIDALPEYIVNFWSLLDSPGVESVKIDANYFSNINLAKIIGSFGILQKIKISIISSELHSITGGEDIDPIKSLLLGPMRVVEQEYSNISCQNIDISIPVNKRVNINEFLLNEILNPEFIQIVCQRGVYKWLREFKEIPGPINDEKFNHEEYFVENGHYIITGGLGGIGLALASRIAKKSKSRFTLISRNALPEPALQDDWLKTHSANNHISKKIISIRNLEYLGCQIKVYPADVTDAKELQLLITKSVEVFGDISGVIHAAGIASGGLIQGKSREESEAVISAKVTGTINLARALSGKKIPFLCLCSSVTSIMGGFGQADYCAANVYLDSSVNSEIFSNIGHVFSINWDPWKEVGMAVNIVKQGNFSVGKEVHPLLGYNIKSTANLSIYKSRLNADDSWVLKEHLILNVPTVPGTSYIEMARSAIVDMLGSKSIAFKNVYFLSPLSVNGSEWHEVTTQITKEADSYQFVISSQKYGKESKLEHAKGTVFIVDEYKPQSVDLNQLWSNYQEIDNDQLEGNINERIDTHEGNVSFNSIKLGERWENFEKVAISENAGMIHLKLPKKYVSDLDIYRLHPALLDCATAFLAPLIRVEFYFPLFYGSFKIYQSLPSECYSISKLRKKVEKNQNTIGFDVSIYDSSGELVAEIEDFSMRKIPKENSSAEKEGITSYSDELDYGLSTDEALDAFERVLISKQNSVVVTKSKFEHEVNENRNYDIATESLDNDESGNLQERPDLTTAYSPPKTGTEKRLASLWQNMLSIQKIGINDDFFELGGDSLVLMQIHSQLSNITNKKIGISDLYNYPTIKSLAESINKDKSEKDEKIEKIDQRAAQMKLAMKNRRHKKRAG